MKIALVDGHRREAEPGLSGICQGCGSVMIPKCGERRIWHWAHRGTCHCDHYWEPETLWHRGWKNKFPFEWQEISHQAHNGEKHIADVKTPQGAIIEFQHSYLKPAERRSREAFYESMIWVVNGLRRKRDKLTFYRMCRNWRVVRLAPLTFELNADQCVILRDWIDSSVPVFFDFGVAQEDINWFGVPVLWRLSSKSANGSALLSPVPIFNFIEALRKGEPIKGIQAKVVKRRVEMPALVPHRYQYNPPCPLGRRQHSPLSFRQFMARERRARSLPRF
jgi:competence protein CoiA